jgi:hypothetical protein
MSGPREGEWGLEIRKKIIYVHEISLTTKA